jgi:ubiquinone/menaquinone biosynthesis C-methylase UbiE
VKRIPSRELLDDDAGTPSEIADSMTDLRGINQRFGGIATTEHMLQAVARESGQRSLSLLEVGAGNGDLPRLVHQRLQQRNICLEITLLDRVYSHLGNCGRCVVADALMLPFSDNSFDVVSCSLFLHHLGPSEVIAFVKESLRCCRTAVVINDLVRSRIHLALVYAGLPLFRSRITRNDAPASVRQAYTPQEMRSMLSQTDAARLTITRHYLYRMGVIAWKKPSLTSNKDERSSSQGSNESVQTSHV